jgi:NADH-quinone oxidoreductase subunit L
MNGNPSLHLLWIPLLPFLGFLINGTIGRRLSRGFVTAVALLSTGLSLALVANILLHAGSIALPHTEFVAPWIQAGFFHADFAFTVDQLTMVFLCVITGVGFLIHLYSVGYMAHEEGFWRFFAYLNLFMFFMLVLVLSSSFLLLFVGWEGVGLASYLLIGFYFTKDSAANAGKKAFIVNRIGDFGFLLAMFLLIAHFGTLSFNGVFAQIAATPLTGGFLTAIALLLVVGATGKSAQIPLYIWLPDAMEGPTPVSALIHAATMVTAGIYMVARCHVLFDRSPYALGVIAIIGAATALFAATVGIVQHDIKRVLAYSTVSQLGYMFMACGVGAYEAGVFHLMTHAFFKALLFLAAGSVIHALSGQQDMRVMGGLRKRIPVTFWTMTAGVFAIAGIPPFAAFFSKDEILYQTFIWNNPMAKPLWAIGMITAGLTSFYMFRLWFKTFFGEPRFDEHHVHVHESPWIMTLPLGILALLSIIGGWVGVPLAFGGHNEFEHFLGPVFNPTEHVAAHIATRTPELGLAVTSVVVALLGFFVAYLFYYRKPGTGAALAKKYAPVYSLLDHKYWVDEIYGALIVTPLLVLSRIVLNGLVEVGIVQGTGATLSATTTGLASITRRMQSGNIRSYAGWLAIGAAAVIAIVLFTH